MVSTCHWATGLLMYGYRPVKVGWVLQASCALEEDKTIKLWVDDVATCAVEVPPWLLATLDEPQASATAATPLLQ